MSFELQVQSSVLGALTARAVQARLFTTCFAPFGSIYIDHVDVADTPVAIVAGNAAVRLRVPVDVFVVRRNDVLAAPNRVPVGATTPAGTVIVVLEMAAIGPIVSLHCVDADLGMVGLTLGTHAPAAKAALIQAVGSPITVNLTVAQRKLLLPTTKSARVELVANVVSIRFDSIGPAAVHLFHGQEWGMFLDSTAVERLAESKMLDDLSTQFTSSTIGAHWQPSDTVPRVDLRYSGKVSRSRDKFSANVSGKLECEFSLTAQTTRLLRRTVRWSLAIDSADSRSEAKGDLAYEDGLELSEPQKFGGVPVGDHAFFIDTALPEISFGGARFGYDGIPASPAGMTIGGLVKLPLDPGRKILHPSVTPFGQPFRLEFCSMLVHPSEGASAPNVPVGEANTHGRVWLENLGAFGDVEIISPGNWIAPFLDRPAASPEIRLAIPSTVAARITAPVRFIVRTARGVRFIDLGTPPRAIVDADGNVTNAVVEFIDDCRYVSAGPEEAFGIDWGSGTDGDEEPAQPASSRSDWAGYLGRQRGIDVQLVTLFALEPNEVIQFRSTDHAVDITADHKGRAVVPVILPVADGCQRASLIRANRRSITGHFSIRTAVLMNQSSLPNAMQYRFNSTAGTFHSTTVFENRSALRRSGQREVERLETSLVLAGEASHQYASAGGMDVGVPSVENAYDPALQSVEEQAVDDRHPFSNGTEFDGNIQSLFAVPGFADAPIALATLTNGTTMVLDLNETGVARVAGTFVGPIGALEVSGNWGSAEDSERISVYRSIKN